MAPASEATARTGAALPVAVADETLIEPLSARERDVLRLMAEGLSNKLIARDLGISEHTVKYHVNAILGKLGAQSRTEAVVRATRIGLILL
jgi:DNA-binding NarL/FixJ family response regulator